MCVGDFGFVITLSDFIKDENCERANGGDGENGTMVLGCVIIALRRMCARVEVNSRGMVVGFWIKA